MSPQRLCPICQKPDWCSVAHDGSAACCMRVADGAEHHVDLAHGRAYIHKLNGHPVSRPSYVPCRSRPFDLDYPSIMGRWEADTRSEILAAHAAQLGVSGASLNRLDVMWCGERGAWAWPMCDARRRVVGIRLRTESGDKFSLPGSKAGVFIPSGLNNKTRLLVCEGPTDTAAALTLGQQAIGRPSCSGGTDIICDLLQAGRRQDVAIIADSDGPGLYGARMLADRLIGICKSVKLIHIFPHSDLRSWLRAGCRPEMLAGLLDAAVVHGER